MNILITGATGLLGGAIIRNLSGFFNIFCTYSQYRPFFCEKNSFRFQLESSLEDYGNISQHVDPNVIIHCAAITNIEKCNNNPNLAISLNSLPSEKLALTFPNAHIIYISTDAVYGIQQGPHSELSLCKPANSYALSKLKGEESLRLLHKRFTIIRTTPVGINPLNLQYGLASWAVNSLRSNTEISGYSNVLFTPISTDLLALEIKHIIDKKIFGTYNISSSDSCSKYEFLAKLLKPLFPEKMELLSAANLDSNSERRAFDQRLSVEKYTEVTGRQLPTINDTVVAILNNKWS